MPPSVNELYIKTRKRENMKAGIALAEVAKKYREHVKSVLSSTPDVALGRFVVGDPEVAYKLEVSLCFTKLENEGWWKQKKTGERYALTRFTKVDTDNRVKFLKDCLIKGVGIPEDCQVFEDHVKKFQVPGEKTYVVVELSVVRVEEYLNGPADHRG